jgi:hypothetical protein
VHTQRQKIVFPEYRGLFLNMMPFIFGKVDSLPLSLHPYLGIIEKCDLEKGSTCYLTVHESVVQEGTTQRRPGVHTEAFEGVGWRLGR